MPVFKNFNIEDLPKVASEFIANMGDNHIFAFEGEMGAGKTTLVAEICRQLGASDDFGSPTFSIVNEYQCENGCPVYHFDFYRLKTPEEALDIGAEDYFYSGELCFIEWSEKIGSLLPEEAVAVNLSVNEDGSRNVEF